MAFVSDESGRQEVYLTSLPGASGKWRISPSGGTQPVWRRDGRQLFYLAADGRLIAVSMDLKAGSPAIGLAETLFDRRFQASASDIDLYDVTADGTRLLINAPLEDRPQSALTVVLDWNARLKS
jgi:Tol biopolymer transport system component